MFTFSFQQQASSGQGSIFLGLHLLVRLEERLLGTNPDISAPFVVSRYPSLVVSITLASSTRFGFQLIIGD